ncbi:MAG TPA: iron-containing redox enzyme family protein [Solirubrobacteraceae bacterium]|nr:iron-containing redox enzyme family protein [Solirubrobacteraceae bacterium]
MDSFFERADAICRRCDVLRHPFYERWSRGELGRRDLGHYVGQYRHAVVALADASAHAGDDQHATEERGHIALWDQFLASYGGDRDAAPAPETAACVAAWAAPGRDQVATLAALYAIESSQPAIAETKRTGLVSHYGAEPDSDATRYFDVHAVLDREHAEQDRRELAGALRPDDEERLLAEIERVLTANWRLLDGVEAVCQAE